MNQVSVKEALIFAEENFPDAPEKLAELLGIEVRRCVFEGDGWCLRHGARALIRINSQAPPLRQRFTLAHELGHLLLDIPSVIGEARREVRDNDSDEEKRVNELAGQLLLPVSIARRFARDLPISLKAIKSLAKTAKVSEPFVVRRLATLCGEIGLLGAAVLFYESEAYKGQFSQGEIAHSTAQFAQELLADCKNAPSKMLVRDRGNQLFIHGATLLSNPQLHLQTILLQKMRRDDHQNETSETMLRRLEKFLLEDKPWFKLRLQGCFGVMKLKASKLTLEEAVALFNEKYSHDAERWDEEFCQRLLSDKGQDYIRLRLQVWTLDDVL